MCGSAWDFRHKERRLLGTGAVLHLAFAGDDQFDSFLADLSIRLAKYPKQVSGWEGLALPSLKN